MNPVDEKILEDAQNPKGTSTDWNVPVVSTRGGPRGEEPSPALEEGFAFLKYAGMMNPHTLDDILAQLNVHQRASLNTALHRIRRYSRPKVSDV